MQPAITYFMEPHIGPGNKTDVQLKPPNGANANRPHARSANTGRYAVFPAIRPYSLRRKRVVAAPAITSMSPHAAIGERTGRIPAGCGTISPITLLPKEPARTVTLKTTLRPEERVAFVLHDMFSVPFGDFDALLHLLNPGLTWHRSNARGHMVRMGANEVLAAIRRGDPDRIEVRKVDVNGEPGLLVLTACGHRLVLMACTEADGSLVGIVSITSRKLLERLRLPGQ